MSINDKFPRGVKGRETGNIPPSVRWAEPEDFMGEGAIYTREKLFLGTCGGALIGASDDRMAVVISANRAGKGASVLTPNLVGPNGATAGGYRGSVLALDPKGELASICARRRHEAGQKVVVLDPFDTVRGPAKKFAGGYNPVSILKPHSETLVEDAELIAESLVVKSGKGDPFWDEVAESFLAGVILHVALHPKYEGRRSLTTVRQLLASGTVYQRGDDKVRNDE